MASGLGRNDKMYAHLRPCDAKLSDGILSVAAAAAPPGTAALGCTFPILVFSAFHPVMACGFTVFLSGVFIVVLMRVFVVADTAVLITVVVMVCTAHGCNGHSEWIFRFGLKFKHVFACFKVVNINRGSRGTALGVCNRLLRTDLAMFSVVVFGFIVAVGFVVVVSFIAALVVFGEGKVVTSIVSVEFFCFSRMLGNDSLLIFASI